jgi:hypothetical protein
LNILDENVREDQRSLLIAWGFPIQQIGSDAGRKGMKDEEIIPPYFAHRVFCLEKKCPKGNIRTLVSGLMGDRKWGCGS